MGQLAVGLFAECRFEQVHGDRVLAAIQIEHITLVMDLKDLKQPIVGEQQWTMRSVMANVHITGGSQGVRLVSRVVVVVLMCRSQDGAHVVLKLAEELRGCLNIPWLVREKLPGIRRKVLYRRSEAEQPGSSRQAVLMPRSTSGSLSIQCKPWSRALRELFNWR